MLRSIPMCLLMATVGCMAPSSKVENGRYNDYRHNISFVAPESWHQAKKVPPNLMPVRNAPNALDERTMGVNDAVFVNASGSGCIAIDFAKTVDNASELRAQEIKNLVENAQISREAILQKSYKISDYRCSATPDCVTDRPFCLATESFKYNNKKDFAFENHLFVFTINNKDTGALRVMLFSEAASLEKNRLVLERLLKTIQRINEDQKAPKELVAR